MRYIFTAAVCTLGVITALLALPPVGGTQAVLVTQIDGDRTAGVETSDTGEPLMRQVGVPADTDGISTQVRGAVEEPSAESEMTELPDGEGDSGDGISDAGNRRLSIGAFANQDQRGISTTVPTTTSAPTTTVPTTTSAPTTTVPTTTSAPTTTAAVTSTTTADQVASDKGVIISATGVVLPVIGRGSQGGWRALTPCGNEVTLREGERVEYVDFVIDPGHGGSESGAIGPNGATEKALNLRISEIVEWYLKREGYSVLLTRRSDIRIPLRSRAEIANTIEPKAFISIHHNGGATRPQATPGTEMFVDAGNPDSRRLGGILFEELTTRLSVFEADWVGTWRNGVSARLNSEGADLYGLHRYTPGVVSVITEAGYLSNASEAELFVDNEVQWAHGRAIADGLIRWDRTSDAGSGFLDDFTDDSSSGTGGFDGCVDPAL